MGSVLPVYSVESVFWSSVSRKESSNFYLQGSRDLDHAHEPSAYSRLRRQNLGRWLEPYIPMQRAYHEGAILTHCLVGICNVGISNEKAADLTKINVGEAPLVLAYTPSQESSAPMSTASGKEEGQQAWTQARAIPLFRIALTTHYVAPLMRANSHLILGNGESSLKGGEDNLHIVAGSPWRSCHTLIRYRKYDSSYPLPWN